MRNGAARLLGTALAVALAACAPPTEPDPWTSAAADEQAGRSESAVSALKGALQRNPSSADLRLQLGRALLDQGHAAAALIELERAAALGQPEAQVAPPTARALLALGQHRPVVDRYKNTALPAGQAAADLQTSVAAAYAAQGLQEPATAAVQQALRLQPGFAPARLLQVRLLAAAGDSRASEGLLQGLLDSDPQDAQAWQLQGDLLARHSARVAGAASGAAPRAAPDAASAAQAYRRSLALRPDGVPAHAGLVAALLRAGDVAGARQQVDAMRAVRPTDPLTAFAEAQVSFAAGDLPKARALSLMAVRALPDNPRLLQFLGLTELQLGAPLAAEPPLLKSLQRAPEAALTRHLLASVYLATGQPGKLEAVLEPLLLQADPEALQQRAQARAQAGLAVATRPPAVPAAPSEAAFLEGRRQLALHDTVAARAAFENALVLAPSHSPSVLALAALDAQGGQPALALARLEALRSSRPHDAEPVLALAALLEGSADRSDRAGTLLADALREHPGNPPLRIAAARQLLRAGKTQAAELVLKDGTAAMSGNAELLDALGRLQLQQRAFGQALLTFNKLQVLRPGAIEPLLRTAEAHVGLGETARARQALQRALAQRPGSLQAQRGLISLALLERQPQAALALARQVQKQAGALGVGLLLEGDVLVSTGNPSGAAAAYLDGLRRTPGTEVAAKAHAALLAQGRNEAARALAADWQRTHPRDADFAMHLGNGALARGDAAAAEGHFQEAVRLQPLHGLALNNLAVAMLKLQHAGARAFAERAAVLLPDSAGVQDTLAAARRFERAPVVALDAGPGTGRAPLQRGTER